ncbi:cation:proton antiporter [Tianweitania sp.]|uniref:cation:proton antiporter n=1 Tax=Tianweitania sp. TaxID=2021634 RepID=UPI00289D35BB|nr:cation:proton antiporter [Tianweitania sp.]
MNLAADFLWLAIHIALSVLSLAFLMAMWRVLRGPTLPDRVVGLDTLVVIAIGFIATIGIKTGFTLYVDIGLALGLVGFLATVAFARFTLSLQGKIQQRSDETEKRLNGEQGT